MKVKIVTGFVPLDNPRAVDEFHILGSRLCDMATSNGIPLQFFYEHIGDMWLWKWLHETGKPTWTSDNYIPRPVTHSISDNPLKNTVAYHCVQHQKTEWLARAAMEDTESDIFIWIDYGIFHLKDVGEGNILGLLDRVDERGLLIPGCTPRRPIDDTHPCWRFCGGLIVAPRRYISAFDYAVKREAKRHIREHGNVSWEVNTWARAELCGSLLATWYQADHNETMFTNYGRAECLEYA